MARVFPEASFICLYRHPMDVVHSGLEACPWSFRPYGFEPYVRASPGNLVQAIIQYWIDRTTRMLEFEEGHADRCHRVYYEVLASQPEDTVRGLLLFVGVDLDLGICDRALRRPYDLGPGDHKAMFTHSISTDAIGGARSCR